MRTLGLVDACDGTLPLSGGHLLPVGGRPLVALRLARLRRSRLLDEIVVLAATTAADDRLAEVVEQEGFRVQRVEPRDCLAGAIAAAEASGVGQVLWLGAHCPLPDPGIIDEVLEAQLAGGADFSSNTLVPTWPRGLEVEVMTLAALKQAAGAATPEERMQPGLHLQRHPEKFRLRSVEHVCDLSVHRVALETAADLAVVEGLCRRFLPQQPEFGFREMIDHLERPA